MCGRFTQTFSWRKIHDLLSMPEQPVELAPRYNVAPGQKIAAVRMEEDQRRLVWLHWGLIPGWAEDPAVRYRLINARSETASSKPSFRAAFRSRRCLIPASGFYEWRRTPAVRQPYLISRVDGQPMVFAGLWEHWTVPRGNMSMTTENCTPNGVRPCEWTGSSRGFDRARSVLILELHRAQIA